MTDESIYYLFLWFVAAIAGVSRSVHNGDYKDMKHVVAVSFMSGLLAFAVVAISGGRFGDEDFNPVFYLGVASIVGLSGREQTQIISAIWKRIIGTMDNSTPPA